MDSLQRFARAVCCLDPLLEPWGLLTFSVILLHLPPVFACLGLAFYGCFQYAMRFVDPIRVEGAVNTDPSMIWREQEGASVLVPKVFRKGQNLRQIPMSEVNRHCKRDDAWVCVEGLVYDITKFVERHPGGWLPIANLAGKDVTDAFSNYHPAQVYEKLLPSYCIGEVQGYHVPPFVQEHRAIRQELLRRGLFATRPSYYMRLVLWYLSLLGSAICLTALRSEIWAHMLGAVILAIFFQQVAFLGHDIGHNGVSHRRAWDLWYGILFGNPTAGISLGWWKRSHNVHHVVCNSIENDPDIQHLPLFAVDKAMLSPYYSSYHQHNMAMDALARWLVSYQHWLYYPAMFCARVNLYVQSYKLLLSREYTQHQCLELCTLLTFAVWQIVLLWTLDTWPERMCHFLLSHGLAGILHVQITISHFAEDCYHGQAYNNDSDEWFRMQLKGTMNVDCSPWLDWFHGGLQFQIEHHLFPRIPRHNLRECRVMVQALCRKHGITYNEMTFFRGNLRVLRKMRATAHLARRLTSGNGGFYTSRLYEAVNAIG